MISISLATLRTRISQVSEETITTSGAVPQALVDAWVNEAIHNYETERARAAGGATQRVATVTTTSSTTPGTHSFPANEVVALEGMTGNVRAVLSVWSVNPRYQLEPMLPQDRTAQVYSNQTRQGRPQSYQVIEVAEAAPTSELMLRIWPPADSAYSLEVNYLPNFTSLSADGDLFQYVEGTLDAVVYDVVTKLLERSDEADTNQYARFIARRDRAYSYLRKTLGQRRRGVLSVRDDRAEKYASLRRPYR